MPTTTVYVQLTDEVTTGKNVTIVTLPYGTINNMTDNLTIPMTLQLLTVNVTTILPIMLQLMDDR